MCDKKLSSLDYFLWQEFRMLRLDLAKQPGDLREAIMEYEELLLFDLIDEGFFNDSKKR